MQIIQKKLKKKFKIFSNFGEIIQKESLNWKLKFQKNWTKEVKLDCGHILLIDQKYTNECKKKSSEKLCDYRKSTKKEILTANPIDSANNSKSIWEKNPKKQMQKVWRKT